MNAVTKPCRRILAASLFAAPVLLALACDPPAESAPATTTATSSADAAGEPDLSTYCQTMCERTSRCGLELARREARSADEKLLSELEKAQKDDAEQCLSACQSQPVTEKDRFQLERAQICLGKTDCDELSRCIAAL